MYGSVGRSVKLGLSSITNIPKIMRARGWLDGAQLMEKWFAGPPTKPAFTTPDTTTIKMNSWVLTFSRAKSVFDGLVRSDLKLGGFE